MKTRKSHNGRCYRRTVFLCVSMVLFVIMLSAGLACGDKTGTGTVTKTEEPDTTNSYPTFNTDTVSGPVMPNVDESQVAAVEAAASQAFSQDWGDGSGVSIVWGPNIISDWALIGVENESGLAGKDVLLRREGGSWQVKDMGHALGPNWESQTPPGLWPSY